MPGKTRPLPLDPDSIAKGARHLEQHSQRDGDCIVFTGQITDEGYGAMVYGGIRQIRAHRVAYLIAKGPIPEGKILRHTCDVRSCINPEHLIPGTRQQNMQDAMERNRIRKHQEHGMAKLTNEQTAVVKAALAVGATPAGLAQAFGVSKGAIYHIRRGTTWGDLNLKEAS